MTVHSHINIFLFTLDFVHFCSPFHTNLSFCYFVFNEERMIYIIVLAPTTTFTPYLFSISPGSNSSYRYVYSVPGSLFLTAAYKDLCK